jgi:hypothetical protein
MLQEGGWRILDSQFKATGLLTCCVCFRYDALFAGTSFVNGQGALRLLLISLDLNVKRKVVQVFMLCFIYQPTKDKRPLERK